MNMRKKHALYNHVFIIQHQRPIYNHQGTTLKSVQQFHTRSFADK